MPFNEMISLDTQHLEGFVSPAHLRALQPKAEQVVDSLWQKTCIGHEFLGWLELPYRHQSEEIARLKETAAMIRDNADHLIVIGIGGSYLGAKSAIEFMSSPFRSALDRVLYFGHHLSAQYTADLLEFAGKKNVFVNIVSKSGGTTEPAVAFRLLRKTLKSVLTEAELRERIIITTDPEKGLLREMAETEKYTTFSIPSDVGGRFSVLCPAGLLPIAVAGLDIDALLAGARDMADLCKSQKSLDENPALKYAAIRHHLYRLGKKIEVFASFLPNLMYLGEWLKQLFGESEGKDGKGLFPASVNFTTDLHSLGQYLQDGERILFETFLDLNEQPDLSELDPHGRTILSVEDDDVDRLNYLAGRSVAEVNQVAYEATRRAHHAGGVPNLTVHIPGRNEYFLGQLYYFFEFAVAVSGLMMGVNPFDQPGVEAYKENMFSLLGRPR